jgi:hypothetical protein
MNISSHVLLHFSIPCFMIQLLQRNQRMYTLLSNYSTVYFTVFSYVSTVDTLIPIGSSNFCAHIHLYKLSVKNLRRFYIPWMIGGLDDWCIHCTLHDDGPVCPKSRRRPRMKILSCLYLSVCTFYHIITYSVSSSSFARQMAAPLLILKWRSQMYGWNKEK